MQTKTVTPTLIQLTRLRAVNAYLVHEDDGFTLVDTMIPGSARDILAAAERLGGAIRRIALTHGHSDHVGSVDALKRELGDSTHVLMPELDARIHAGEAFADKKPPGGWPKLETVPEVKLSAGDRVGSLEVIPTPGHTPGHVSFLDTRDRTVIAGDVFTSIGGLAVSNHFNLRFPLATMATWDKGKDLESARALRALDPQLIVVGHGGPIQTPAAAMDKAIARAGRWHPPRVYKRVEHDGGVDDVAVEEPLEIRVDGQPLAVTMRTPGHDEELALGFLYGEGLIDGPRPATLTDDFAANTIEVPGPLTRDPGQRRFYTTSSCGVCGKGALEEVAVQSNRAPPGPQVPRRLLTALPDRLEQPGFERTGGVHATGLFDAAGQLIVTREDVGRHNAMDKVIGRALIDGNLPLADRVLCVSGRLSFELVQKAAVAGAPILVGVGAPSSLAIELAEDRGITLCGFARRGRINVYTHPERVDAD